LDGGVIGVIDPNRSVHTEGYDVSVNRVISREAESEGQARIRFSLNTKIREVVNPNQINKMMEQDFSECKSEGRALSHEDRVFLKKVNDGIQKLDDGHYEIPLPFKENDTKLLNNKRYVLKRLLKLKIKLKRNEQFRNDYRTFMKDIIDRIVVMQNECHLKIYRDGTSPTMVYTIHVRRIKFA
jgi:hypothetical protein